MIDDDLLTFTIKTLYVGTYVFITVESHLFGPRILNNLCDHYYYFNYNIRFKVQKAEHIQGSVNEILQS